MLLLNEGTLKLFYRLSRVRGHVVALDELEPDDASAGRSEGLEIPQPQFMPTSAVECKKTGVLQLSGSTAVAAAILAEDLRSVEIVAFDVPGQLGIVFAPDTVVVVKVEAMEVLTAEVEAMRQMLARSVPPGAVERAQTLQTVAFQGALGKRLKNDFLRCITARCPAYRFVGNWPGMCRETEVTPKLKRKGVF